MMINPADPIVVGIDGSPHSLQALQWATQEATARRCPLRVVHALQWPLTNELMGPPALGPPELGLQHAAEHILAIAADHARQAAPGLDVSSDLRPCTPAAALVEASRDAAMVVLGHRGLGGFTGLLLGSVGVQVAAHASCPVIVVRANGPDRNTDGRLDESGSAVGQVVVGVDGSELSTLAVDFAFAHAALHRLGVTAVNVYSPRILTAPGQAWPLADDAGSLQDRTRLLSEALAGYRAGYPDVPVRHKIVVGRPAEVLAAESADAALTVLGSRGRGGFTGLLLGSTSQAALHHATGPVAVVRAQTTGHRSAATSRRQDPPPAPDPIK
jgi:nucleotide-binding universal stress UspA family protein